MPENRFVLRSIARFYVHIGDVDLAHDIIRKTNLTKYDANEQQMHLLAGFILTEWLKEDQPTSKYVYDKNNSVTIELGRIMRPYLIELNRLT